MKQRRLAKTRHSDVTEKDAEEFILDFLHADALELFEITNDLSNRYPAGSRVRFALYLLSLVVASTQQTSPSPEETEI